MKKHLIWLACVVGFQAHADNVLIVHGLSTTSETDTTQANMDNWPVVCNAQSQHTITYADTPPANLSGYQQIWDIRFSNTSPLTPADMTAYTGGAVSRRVAVPDGRARLLRDAKRFFVSVRQPAWRRPAHVRQRRRLQ